MLDRLLALKREPALLIDFVETLVILLVAFGVSINGDQQNYLVAAFIALVGLVKGFTTTPFPVSAVTDFGRAALVLGASFGLNLSADQIAITVTMLGTITTLISRAQISPRASVVATPLGSGSGPINDRGAADLSLVGIVVALIGLVLLVLSLVDVLAIGLVWPLIVIVVGVVVYILSRTPTSRV